MNVKTDRKYDAALKALATRLGVRNPNYPDDPTPSVRGLVTRLAQAAEANPEECARLMAPVLELAKEE